MPCRTYDEEPTYGAWTNRESDALKEKQNSIARAGLCALITALYKCSPLIKDVIVSNIDWKQAGITPKQLDDWYREHRINEIRG